MRRGGNGAGEGARGRGRGRGVGVWELGCQVGLVTGDRRECGPWAECIYQEGAGETKVTESRLKAEAGQEPGRGSGG